MIQTVALAVLVAWLLVGVSLSLFMGRRGYEGFSWLVIGTLLGPLALLVAVDTARASKERQPTVVADQPGGGGPVDVLIGFDGSPEARAAAARVLELLGPRTGRLTLATVVAVDAVRDSKQAATAALQQQAERMAPWKPSLELLSGHHAAALQKLAAEDGYDLLVIGTRGAGRSKALLGSAATELARRSAVPVLLVGAQAGAGSESFASRLRLGTPCGDGSASATHGRRWFGRRAAAAHGARADRVRRRKRERQLEAVG